MHLKPNSFVQKYKKVLTRVLGVFVDPQTRVANAEDCSAFRSFAYFPMKDPSSARPATKRTQHIWMDGWMDGVAILWILTEA